MAREQSSYESFIKGLWRENPVFVQVLGMCPMLAVTNTALNSLVMGLATLFVLMGSSFLVASLKHLIPKQVRISLYIIIIATFVTIADYTILALLPAVHKELGAFIPLIVANCMILGRQEAFASRHGVRMAVVDAAGMSAGFMFALLALGGVRELLGNGSLFGVDLFGPGFEPWVIMILPPGGFITLGLLLLLFNWIAARKRAFLAEVAATEREML
ncbi:MAG: electron transport complex subunit RsxE [Candidatus Sedimenticola endophacoides]|uniref:Ion-translocating oxidoreductase complex subunit E n=1 Tax=Candidatus Sedimenticola endophacoides TaxID=2548426 RepID=A0A657PR07_9GAMM|nr:MAG: electron transport complex subunit RsxE [Candidatus Sedimenticola endophacoides]OQX34933.1 MAG: electron transport complex subunit RsxE [Candidatus Sedimenticola endophacoides]OQX39466.1 MAG: electron transport complex subunit RsxE [Candidatus Sedimenticola endophacoides]OQX40339.1 MAG: electron transport complex subunit RsxE [Candidatus Sedimenticola endophacoides]OQX48489.1 MAG: electron transport complex subunit RsxE [Candidatus Sedimenticola endophacoides]